MLTTQIAQALKPDDHPRRAAFAEEILQRIDDDNDYLNSVFFFRRSNFSCIRENQ